MKYPRRCASDTATIGAPVSAAERSVSPANIPRPPEYVGSEGERAISIEKYAIDRSFNSAEGEEENLGVVVVFERLGGRLIGVRFLCADPSRFPCIKAGAPGPSGLR